MIEAKIPMQQASGYILKLYQPGKIQKTVTEI